ncbi:MAG TPA: hypothetical protein PK250_13760 [Syntrophobacter fumaroxidans]|nr:hypothetical protein [Syntrophobacter fumaroxidans]
MSGEIGDYKQLFPETSIPVILSSIAQAGAVLRKKTDTDREDWLTRRLRAQIIKVPEFRESPLGIWVQPEIPAPDPDANAPGGRIDLLVSCDGGPEVYFAIEAKRLSFRSPNGRKISGSSEYVKDGMMRFVTGQYAPHMRAGAMLGYVFDGNVESARSNIDKSIRKKAPQLKLADPKCLVPSSILSKTPIDETRHDLTRRPFTIYHVFVDVGTGRSIGDRKPPGQACG